jgi:hypothetical protein
LSKARVGISAVTSGSKIFFAGGHNWECNRNAGGVSLHVSYDNVDIYDAVTDTWAVAHLSHHRTSMVAAAVGNKVLFAGGYFFTGNTNLNSPIWDVSNRVDIYDLSTRQWSSATLPFGAMDVQITSSATVGTKVYLVAGENVAIYDNNTTSWTTASLQAVIASLSPPPGMAAVNSFTTVGNNLVFYSSNQVGIRNLATGMTSVACMPNRSYPFLVNNSIVFFTDDTYFLVYDTETGVWLKGKTNTHGSMGAIPQNIAGTANTTYMGGGYAQQTNDCATFTDKVFKFTW